MDKRYQVFVSSTYADLQKERQKVTQTLMEMDCIPAGMELFPAADDEQWKFIKRVIDDCDYYILIIGGRYGTLTDEGISYTEKEYDYAISIGLNVLAFVHEQPDEIAVGKSEIDPTLRHKLDQFRGKVATNRLVKSWRSASELPGLVAVSLQKTIEVYPATGWVRASKVASDELLADLNDLRKENARLKATIAEFESRVVPENTDLAPLDDPFPVNLMWWRPRTITRGTDKVIVSWADIFSLVAPDLQGHPSDSAANRKLGEALWCKKHPGSTFRAEIQHEDFQTIRIQLSALGLITTKYTKTTKGSMALFWNLTSKGEQLMTRLRTMKARTTDSGANTSPMSR